MYTLLSIIAAWCVLGPSGERPLRKWIRRACYLAFIIGVITVLRHFVF